MINTKLFKSAMVRKGHTQRTLAAALGIEQSSLSRKINNKRPFKHSELIRLCSLLGITRPKTVDAIFKYNPNQEKRKEKQEKRGEADGIL